MRAIFCGNFEFNTRQSDLEHLFSKYGRVERVDMKSGFAFISMDDERDAEDAIRGLDQREFGRQGRRLRVDWTKSQQERGGRRSGGSRSSGNTRPTKTLFVINFDPMNTRERDLEKHFDPYGKILSVRIRKNFAFVQYDSQEDATKALDATNMSKLMDQVVSVEYAVRNDDGRSNRYSPDQRGRGRSPDRSRGRGRSPSPHRGQRNSPDYGHGPYSERSRDSVKMARPSSRGRDSPVYSRSPSADAKPEPRRSLYQRRRYSPDSSRGASPNTKPEPRGRSYRQESYSPDCVRGPSPNPKPEARGSPYPRARDSPDAVLDASPTTKYEPKASTRGREMDSPDFGDGANPSTRYESRVSTRGRGRERGSPDFDQGASSPNIKSELKGSPNSGRKENPVSEKKYRSRSPTSKTKSGSEKKLKRELTDM